MLKRNLGVTTFVAAVHNVLVTYFLQEQVMNPRFGEFVQANGTSCEFVATSVAEGMTTHALINRRHKKLVAHRAL